ncbi:MAG: thymidine phosphorylase [Clostridiales bacterium]|jgi:pyrimidine-nucleoside phosphorylase|nr:thymidine phosphorylase [Clostridiales bacterium]
MRMYDIIATKRDGKELNYDALKTFVDGYCDGSIPDYQASALLMAMLLKGMTHQEIAELTDIMAKSGDIIDLSGIDGIKVDKHSTGGVGDKTTLVITSIVAACGKKVAKMSGRALGHAGGTIDKLESIPGFKTELTEEEFIENVNRIGCCIAGQTGNIAPADKKIYALRDVTGTVESIPLIASSIMSKKLASGADKMVLDIKVGSGALLKTQEEAEELAEIMIQIGERNGKETIALLTDMDTPLGYAIGNLNEVREAYQNVLGQGPSDLMEICLVLSAEMLKLAGYGSYDECYQAAKEAVASGKAKAKFIELVKNQGGDISVLEPVNDEEVITQELVASEDGYIQSMDTEALGKASMLLGSGRKTKDDKIDYKAGIYLHKKTGMKVSKGDVLATLSATDASKFDEARKVLATAYRYSDKPVETKPIIIARVDKHGIKRY